MVNVLKNGKIRTLIRLSGGNTTQSKLWRKLSQAFPGHRSSFFGNLSYIRNLKVRAIRKKPGPAQKEDVRRLLGMDGAVFEQGSARLEHNRCSTLREVIFVFIPSTFQTQRLDLSNTTPWNEYLTVAPILRYLHSIKSKCQRYHCHWLQFNSSRLFPA